MNCHECQRLLLTCDDPATQPMAVAAHLAECRACQEWYERLLMIDSNVPLIPVPPSRAGDKLVRLFQSAEKEPATLAMRPYRWQLAGLAAAAMAAAVLITVIEMRPGRRIQQVVEVAVKNSGRKDAEQPRPKPLAAVILDCDLRLAKTADPKERVAILAELAEALHGESRSLVQAGGVKELSATAQLYDKVLKDGVVARARAVPMSERRAALDPIAQHLAHAEVSAAQMADAAQADASRADMATALRQIAAAARDGNGVLRELMDEVTP